jgi:hypothetical protein
MGRQAAVVLYGLALVAVVVGVDVLFFRNRFWGAADGERRYRRGVLGVLLEVPKAGSPRVSNLGHARGS